MHKNHERHVNKVCLSCQREKVTKKYTKTKLFFLHKFLRLTEILFLPHTRKFLGSLTNDFFRFAKKVRNVFKQNVSASCACHVMLLLFARNICFFFCFLDTNTFEFMYIIYRFAHDVHTLRTTSSKDICKEEERSKKAFGGSNLW